MQQQQRIAVILLQGEFDLKIYIALILNAAEIAKCQRFVCFRYFRSIMQCLRGATMIVCFFFLLYLCFEKFVFKNRVETSQMFPGKSSLQRQFLRLLFFCHCSNKPRNIFRDAL